MEALMQSSPGARTLINDRWRDYFAGCGYLGLQSHPALVQAAIETLQQYGLSTATSRGGFGEHPVYQHVEQTAAEFFESERAIYFVSGYLGNTILLQGLQGDYEQIFVDRDSHFSVWDGVQNAGIPVTPFQHCDPEDLSACCRAKLRPGERPLVITDGVFPISGEIAPVRDYVDALAPYDGAILCLDDAHATGVIGEKGQGTLEHFGVQGKGRYTTYTLSKALAGHGGVIAQEATVVEKLVRNSTVPGATSPSPLPAAAAAARALELVRGDSSLRRRLWANVRHAKEGVRELGWPVANTPVPILCLGARPGLDLARLQSELFARDICVAHVTRYSSTPPGGALRIAIFATHTAEQIDRMIAELGALV
ncbi:MAG: aminotransferase class I/II-fold pyridoxal phosphate-dependent enzyme [Anaerolineae bacterium]|nr:aminotransferase class I/II-fold pyridoxal phosphate-dependent enzyme [Anaerolineae bacterium]